MENETNANVPKPQASQKLPLGVTGSESLSKLFEALAKAQAEFGVADLDKVNPHFKNKFTSITAIDNATRKQLTKNGLSVTQIPYSFEGKPRMLTILGHSSGEFLAGDLGLILNKQDMQQLGSAITYAKRYCKSAMIGVSSDEDDDGNAAAGIGDNKGDKGSAGAKDNRVASRPPQPEPENYGLDEPPPGYEQFPFEERERENTAAKISTAQVKRLWAIKSENKLPDTKLREVLKDIAGVEHTYDIPPKHYKAVVEAIEKEGKRGK
jgi:hypothetical protein